MPLTNCSGINLNYEEHGEGPPLVFIHGLGSSTRDWDFQVPEFTRKYRMITLDLRGHGQSDKPPGPYTLPMFAADVAELMQRLGIAPAQPAHVVGVSLGGGVAFQLALDYPPLVKTLTIVNSAPATAASHDEGEAEVNRRVAIVQQMGMRAMAEALAPNLFPGTENDHLREDFIRRWAENNPQAYIEATRSMSGWDVGDRISEICCPVLVIAADQDYSPLEVKEAYVKMIPDARLVVIQNSHHGVPMERPKEFNAALSTFLAEHD